jgi:hypothetical protein
VNLDRQHQGCDLCERGAYAGTWPPPARIAVIENGPTFLHKCELCGTYWEFTISHAYPITEIEARTRYPDAFLANLLPECQPPR